MKPGEPRRRYYACQVLVHISISLRLRSPACCTRVQSRSPSTLCLITFTHLHHAAGRPPHPVALHILFLVVAHLSKCEHVRGAGSGATKVASTRGLVLLSFHSHRFGGGCGHWTRRSGRLPQRQRMTAAPVNAAPSSMESECGDGCDRCYLLLDGEPAWAAVRLPLLLPPSAKERSLLLCASNATALMLNHRNGLEVLG